VKHNRFLDNLNPRQRIALTTFILGKFSMPATACLMFARPDLAPFGIGIYASLIGATAVIAAYDHYCIPLIDNDERIRRMELKLLRLREE
tara:strand:+ start:2173 stop:2442 length:270 start_codon:yes stop_codon:yes gene_type:complete